MKIAENLQLVFLGKSGVSFPQKTRRQGTSEKSELQKIGRANPIRTEEEKEEAKRQLLVQTCKLFRARERARDQVSSGAQFDSDWFKCDANFQD